MPILTKDEVLHRIKSKESLEHEDLSWIDLSGEDLSYANLKGVTLTGAILLNCNLSHTNLEESFLAEANFQQSNFQYANLKRAFLQRTILHNVDFSYADLSEVSFPLAKMNNANLSYIIAVKGSFRDMIADGCNFTGANFSYANLRGASLKEGIFHDVDLSHSDMRKVKLNGASFKNIKDDEILFYGKKPWDGIADKIGDWDDRLPLYQDE